MILADNGLHHVKKPNYPISYLYAISSTAKNFFIHNELLLNNDTLELLSCGEENERIKNLGSLHGFERLDACLREYFFNM